MSMLFFSRAGTVGTFTYRDITLYYALFMFKRKTLYCVDVIREDGHLQT